MFGTVKYGIAGFEGDGIICKGRNEYSNPAIRQFKVALDYNFKEPLTDVKPALWKELTPVTALSFSAVAYFLCKDLYDKLKVPIGIINASVGGSPRSMD